MWRNIDVVEFVDWLRRYNDAQPFAVRGRRRPVARLARDWFERHLAPMAGSEARRV